MTEETLRTVLSCITYGGATVTLAVAAVTLYRHRKEKHRNH